MQRNENYDYKTNFNLKNVKFAPFSKNNHKTNIIQKEIQGNQKTNNIKKKFREIKIIPYPKGIK